MATCAHTAQAVAMAAALCRRDGLLPRDVGVKELQRDLLRRGQYIPGMALDDPEDLARAAGIRASSEFAFGGFLPSGETVRLDASRAMLLPVAEWKIPAVTFLVDVTEATTLEVEIRGASRRGNFTPDETLFPDAIPLAPGPRQPVSIRCEAAHQRSAYLFFALLRNPAVSVHLTDTRVTGILSVSQMMNAAVAKGTKQEPPAGSGIDSFEFWLPVRRPGGKNLAITVDPPLRGFAAASVANGMSRPVEAPNAWVAAPGDSAPRITLRWDSPQTIARVELVFDTDFEHPMESVLWGHPERDMPFCVRDYRITGADGAVLAECRDNHQTRNSVRFEPVATSELHVEVLATHGTQPAIFEIRCYAE